MAHVKTLLCESCEDFDLEASAYLTDGYQLIFFDVKTLDYGPAFVAVLVKP